MVNFRPFKLILEQCTPVVLNREPVHLDMVVHWALACKTGFDAEQVNLLMANEYLKYNPDHDVFHASALMFGVTSGHTLTATKMTHTGRLRESQLSKSLFAPNAMRGKYNRIRTEGGPAKQRLNSFNAYAAPYMVFYGYGNAAKVKALIDFFVQGIGKDAANCGWGAIGQVQYIHVPNDLSLIKSGQPSRYLPESYALQEGMKFDPAICQPMVTSPPYWKKAPQASVLPCIRIRSEPVLGPVDVPQRINS